MHWLREARIELPNLCFLSVKNCFPMYHRYFCEITQLRHYFSAGKVIPFVCKIQAPSLAYCVLPNFGANVRVQLECFEKIRYIKCDYFDRKTAEKAVNLETLVCKQLDLSFRLDELPKLKEIALFPYVRPPSEKEQYNIAYNFETAHQSLREQRASFARSDLQIVVNGFEDVNRSANSPI